jgi:hypothetical protein
VTRLSFLEAVQQPAKLEVRGAVEALRPASGERLLPLGPRRALLVTGRAGAAARLAADGYLVYDMTAALATVDVDGEDLLRRLTDLDPQRLPATGSVARGTPALIERRDDGGFRLHVPCELAQYVADVVADLAEGLGR